MEMMNSVPTWLTVVGSLYVAIAVASAAFVAFDIFGRGNRQASMAMDVVWPASALYLGPLAVWLYGRWGRRAHAPELAAQGLAGGAASTLAHLVGVPLVISSGLTIAGIDLWVMILVIAVLATALLAVFERAGGHRFVPAAAVALVTVLAFDVGMGGWMLLLHFSENMPAATTAAFWFLMQLGVVLGTLTALPVIRLLAARSTETVATG